jgi:hypothetical protein
MHSPLAGVPPLIVVHHNTIYLQLAWVHEKQATRCQCGELLVLQAGWGSVHHSSPAAGVRLLQARELPKDVICSEIAAPASLKHDMDVLLWLGSKVAPAVPPRAPFTCRCMHYLRPPVTAPLRPPALGHLPVRVLGCLQLGQLAAVHSDQAVLLCAGHYRRDAQHTAVLQLCPASCVS